MSSIMRRRRGPISAIGKPPVSRVGLRKTHDPLRQEPPTATAPYLPRQRLRSIPRESATQRIGMKGENAELKLLADDARQRCARLALPEPPSFAEPAFEENLTTASFGGALA